MATLFKIYYLIVPNASARKVKLELTKEEKVLIRHPSFGLLNQLQIFAPLRLGK